MYEGITRELSELIVGITYDQLPESVIETTKLALLDSLGCILAGPTTDRGRIALEMLGEFGVGVGDGAAVVGYRRTGRPGAAFGNSELMNALDYDYIGPISGHVAPYVIPPCLAIADHRAVSGPDLILALALANEVGGRSISAFAQHKVFKNSPPWYEEHSRFTYASAVFGGVAGAARLLGLTCNQVQNALGIAGASTPVPATMKWQHMSGPAIMAKYNAWTGWVAQLATLASISAGKGFTGDTTIFDGEYGYWTMVGSPSFSVDNLLVGLGTRWHVDQIRFKLYPTCYIYHAGVQGIAQLVRQHGIAPDAIQQITVYGDELMQTPNRMGTEVNTFADAQFFIRFNYALAVFYGDRPTPAWQMPEVFRDPRIVSLIDKVVLKVHPQFEEYIRDAIGSGTVPILWSSIVEIRTATATYRVEVPSPRGSKEAPASRDELLDKFWTNAGYSRLRPARLQAAVDAILKLESVDDMRVVFDLLIES